MNLLGGVMVSVLALDYTIGICFFSTKCSAQRRKGKDGFAWN